ncbi:MAG: DNA-protecting protein DprA [Candidatus Hydrogenedens sp.]|nr:DNA-protecting protein DprA [Candidatus Hydrogenedens sp.]
MPELTEDQRAWLALSLVPGVGDANLVKLLARFGNPASVLAADEASLADCVSTRLARNIRAYRETVDVDGAERRMREYGATLVTMDDEAYPLRLAEIYGPPSVLYVRGTLQESDAHAIAIVGTRHATEYGRRMARELAQQLASRGVTVVSGLAAGVDTAAHEGALEAGGRTIAVLGNGVDIVFPAENAELMHRITRSGAVVSPFPMGAKGFKGNFPIRNRIISGMTLGTLVIEAPPGSGALITARDAAEQGREVFALPGQVSNPNSRGPHALLKEGAKLVETVDDILTELEVPARVRVADTPRVAAAAKQAAAAPKPAGLSGVEQDILESLSPEGSFVDEIALVCRIPVSEALSSLTMLELKGAVRQLSGKRFTPA